MIKHILISSLRRILDQKKYSKDFLSAADNYYQVELIAQVSLNMYMSHSQVVQQQNVYHQFNGAIFSDISFGFMPAFKHLIEQQVHLSKNIDGELSVMHLFDGLPDHWINEKDKQGKALSLKADIIAGFMRNAQFYTLSEIIHDIRDS